MAYLIDSDVFIQAKNLHYGFDICPAFWDWIVINHAVGQVFSVEKIGLEIAGANDDLSAWAANRGAAFFLPPTAATTASLAVVSAWASDPNNGYTPGAIATFLASGDLYLVAHAHAHGGTVVTHETAQNTPTRIKIPNVCSGVTVECMNPFRMLRAEGANFVLGAAANVAAVAPVAHIGGALAAPQAPQGSI